MTLLNTKIAFGLESDELSEKRIVTRTILNYCELNKIRHWDECMKLAAEANKLSIEINDNELRGLALLELGYQHWFRDNFDQAVSLLTESCQLLKKSGDYYHYSRATAVVSSIYWGKGQRKQAIEKAYEGLRLVKLLGEKNEALWLEWFLGIFYYDLKDFKNAESQYLKALAILESLRDNSDNDAYAYCLIGLGAVLMKTGRNQEAIIKFKTALEFCKEHKLWMQEARCLQEIGEYYKRIGDPTNARKYFESGYLIRKEKKTKPALVTSILSLAEFLIPNDIEKAFEMVNEALELSKEIGASHKEVQCYELLSNLYERNQDYQRAYSALKISQEIRNSCSGSKFTSEIKNLERKFMIGVLEEERDSLSSKNLALKEANTIIKSQYRAISDSLKYAQRIQSAMLPSCTALRKNFNDLFLFYQPKEIVAGDFYWTKVLDDERILVAVADCTGHGVPGAIMSVLCNEALNRSVVEYGLTQPEDILNKTRRIIIEKFARYEEDVYDGMDISLCSINTSSGELIWAGANSKIIIISKGTAEILVSDKQPVGKYPKMTPFTSERKRLEKGDSIYLFSDGYSDQFGGAKNKKMGFTNFSNLLIEHTELPMTEQLHVLSEKLTNWQGHFDQVDDITVMGIRL